MKRLSAPEEENTRVSELTAVSPIDGRYRKAVSELTHYCSEHAFIRHRIKVELEYLIALSDFGIIRKVNEAERKKLRGICTGFSEKDSEKIKELEKALNHDVKAIENFIREKVPKDLREAVHMGLTSEDVNSMAQGLMLKGAISQVYVPVLVALLEKLALCAESNKALGMLSRTHGQPASPTTLGKEFANYCFRLRNELEKLMEIKVPGKLTGATGNFDAHCIAFPQKDWPSFSARFVSSLGLEPVMMTTQIIPHERLSELLDCMRRANGVVLDLSKNLWLYIMLGYFTIRAEKGEVGSSTMPHKVNPIDFENAEGNLELANALLALLSSRLQLSRLQRDLSDSTIKRNYGVAIAHGVIGLKSLLRGLEKIKPNDEKIHDDLKAHGEVLSEAMQTILRKEGVSGAYEKIKELTRDRDTSLSDVLRQLNLPQKAAKELLSLRLEDYTGLATKLAETEIMKTRKFLRGIPWKDLNG